MFLNTRNKFNRFFFSENTKYLNIVAESDVVLAKKAIRGFKLNVAVDVPLGCKAKIVTSPYTKKGVSILSNFISSKSRKKNVKGFIRNHNDVSVLIRKGDILGELIILQINKVYQQLVPYTVEIIITED